MLTLTLQAGLSEPIKIAGLIDISSLNLQYAYNSQATTAKSTGVFTAVIPLWDQFQLFLELSKTEANGWGFKASVIGKINLNKVIQKIFSEISKISEIFGGGEVPNLMGPLRAPELDVIDPTFEIYEKPFTTISLFGTILFQGVQCVAELAATKTAQKWIAGLAVGNDTLSAGQAVAIPGAITNFIAINNGIVACIVSSCAQPNLFSRQKALNEILAAHPQIDSACGIAALNIDLGAKTGVSALLRKILFPDSDTGKLQAYGLVSDLAGEVVLSLQSGKIGKDESAVSLGELDFFLMWSKTDLAVGLRVKEARNDEQKKKKKKKR